MAFQFTSLPAIISRAFLIACLPISGPSLVAQPQSSEETTAQAAEQAGKTRDAFTHYLAAIQQAAPGSDADQRLREKIISLARKLTPPPLVPNDVQAHLSRGRTAVQNAQDADGLRRAAAEFQEASKLAPWLGNIYFNLGAIDEKAGLYTEAIRNFNLYLLATPSSPDSEHVKTRIADLQSKLEQQRQDETTKKVQAEKEARLREAQQKVDYLKSQLAGLRLQEIYICLPAPERMRPGRMSGWGCTDSELQGSHWSEMPYQMKVIAIKQGPPQVELVGSAQDILNVKTPMNDLCFNLSDYQIGQAEFRRGIWRKGDSCDDKRYPYSKVNLQADWNGSPAIYVETCTEGTNCTEKTAQYLVFSR